MLHSLQPHTDLLLAVGKRKTGNKGWGWGMNVVGHWFLSVGNISKRCDCFHAISKSD